MICDCFLHYYVHISGCRAVLRLFFISNKLRMWVQKESQRSSRWKIIINNLLSYLIWYFVPCFIHISLSVSLRLYIYSSFHHPLFLPNETILFVVIFISFRNLFLLTRKYFFFFSIAKLNSPLTISALVSKLLLE